MYRPRPTRKYGTRSNNVILDMKPLQKEYLYLTDMVEEIVSYLETHRIDHRNYMYADITSKKISNMLQIVLDSFHSEK